MAVERATALTSRLLSFTRKRKDRSLCFDITYVAEEVVDLIQYSFDRGIRVFTELEKDLGCIEGDPNQLYQVLLNLCINARDAILERENGMGREVDGQKGSICIRIHRVDLDEERLHVNGGFKEGPHACLSVADDGVGMDGLIRSRIFEPFFTTKQKWDGTGLGLAIVYGIVQSYNGFIKVDSEPGKGTEFKIYFPLKEESLLIKASKQYEVVQGRGTILVVEDEVMMRDVLKEMLIQLGYSTFVARDGKEGLDLFRERHKEIDLVILDLLLPEMDGVEIFFKMKKINPDVKVVVISGVTENEEIKELKKAALLGFIKKPFDMGKISKTIDHLLHSHSKLEQGFFQG